MANQYETYLNRLRNIKANRPEMKVYERNLSAMAQPFNLLNRKMASLTQRGGASTAAQVAALNEGRGQWNQLQQQGYGQALDAAGKREEGLDLKIAEVEMQNEQFKEAQSKEKAAKRTSALRTGLQVGGMALGALLAAPTGGMSLLMGASLGGVIGQTASGFMGVNKDGNLTTNPEEWDTELIGQGLSSTAQVLTTNANQMDTKNKLNFVSANAGKLGAHIMSNPANAPMIQFQFENLMKNGSMSDIEAWFNSLSGGTPAGSPITITDLDNRA